MFEGQFSLKVSPEQSSELFLFARGLSFHFGLSESVPRVGIA